MIKCIIELDCGLYDEETGQVVFKPTIKEEMIRCKDCKHWDGYYCHNQGWGNGYAHYSPPIKTEDGYCDWAERK